MSPTKKRKDRRSDPLAPYRAIRRPMPPPSTVERDRRRRLEEEQARSDLEDEARREP